MKVGDALNPPMAFAPGAEKVRRSDHGLEEKRRARPRRADNKDWADDLVARRLADHALRRNSGACAAPGILCMTAGAIALARMNCSTDVSRGRPLRILTSDTPALASALRTSVSC